MTDTMQGEWFRAEVRRAGRGVAVTDTMQGEWFRAEVRALAQKVDDIAAGDCGVYEGMAVASVLERFADVAEWRDSYESAVLRRQVERLARLADR